MKSVIPFFFLLFGVFSFAQQGKSRIDLLSSAKDAENLIHSINKDYAAFKVRPVSEIEGIYFADKSFCKRVADSLKIDKSFYKADFDNNGLTDLLAIGDYYDFTIITVMDFGNDSLQINPVTRRSFQSCIFPKITFNKKGETILEYYYNPEYWRYRSGAKKDQECLAKKSLIYKFGDLVEYNETPTEYAIEKIEYKTTMCFGVCPEFTLTIQKNRMAEFNAKRYNINRATYGYGNKNAKEIKGLFQTEIDTANYTLLTDLLNYIDFPSLENNYEVNWTDDQFCTLKITYNNGIVKEVNDYGLIGTYGLDRLYQILFDLRFNQEWKPINKETKL